MVVVTEKTLEERSREEAISRKYDSLVVITEGMIEGHRIHHMKELGFFSIYDINDRRIILVNIPNEYLQVFSEDHFGEALRLAETYEKAIGKEFTLKKGY